MVLWQEISFTLATFTDFPEAWNTSDDNLILHLRNKSYLPKINRMSYKEFLSIHTLIKDGMK